MDQSNVVSEYTQITKFMGPTWDPPGFCRPQMGPMLAPWTLLSGYALGSITLQSLESAVATTSGAII